MRSYLLCFIFFIGNNLSAVSQLNLVENYAKRIYEKESHSLSEKSRKLKSLKKVFKRNNSLNYYLALNELDRTQKSKRFEAKQKAFLKSMNLGLEWMTATESKQTESLAFFRERIQMELQNFMDTTLTRMEAEKLLLAILPFFPKDDFSANSSVSAFQLKRDLKQTPEAGLPIPEFVLPAFDSKEEEIFLILLNQARKEKGMKELVLDEDLSRACRYHAWDMAKEDYFTHESQDRTKHGLVTVGLTFARIQIFAPFCTSCSENIAAGNSKAKATYEQWYNSPGHYRNMFNPDASRIGVGHYYEKNSTYGSYWVMNTSAN